MILHSCPLIDDDILTNIEKVLTSKMIAQGEVVEAFEKGITDYIGGYRTVCVGCGTAALLLSLKILNINDKDEVILPSLVCRSVYEATAESGAVPVLCDVDDNWVVSYNSIEPFITNKTKAIIVPHLYGIKADIEEIKKLNVPIIEDCAQAFGRTIDNKKIGTEGDLAVFSFNPTKCLTTGEGGGVMINGNNKQLAEKLLRIRSGDTELSRRFFSPMSNISAAIGISQLEKYDIFLEKRFRIAGLYNQLFGKTKGIQCLDNSKNSTMYYRYVVKTEQPCETYIKSFEREGVIARRGADLLLHRAAKQDPKKFENSEYLFKHTLSIPIYPALKEEEVTHICKVIDKIFN